MQTILEAGCKTPAGQIAKKEHSYTIPQDMCFYCEYDRLYKFHEENKPMRNTREKTLRPSKEIWAWYRGKITVDSVLSAIADKLAGYHISSSAKELLKDLKLMTDKGNITKEGKDVLATELHNKFHHKQLSIEIIDPTKDK